MLAHLYHLQHQSYDEDLPFWLGLTQPKDGPLLELGCGSGSVLLPLAAAGFTVFGIDYDPTMLAVLRENLSATLAPQVELLCADMTDLALDHQFGAVLLPCNTYSTLIPDQRQTLLARVASWLQPGGVFALSVPNPVALAEMPDTGPEEIEMHFDDPVSGCPVQVSSGWQRGETTFTIDWYYDLLHGDGVVERWQASVHHQLTSVETYCQELSAAGLTPQIYGDFDRQPYQPESAYLVIVAENA